MNQIAKTIATFVICSLPLCTLADDKVHTLSFDTAFGNTDYKKGDTSDDSVSQASFRYSYEIVPTYEVELGYTVGSDTDDFLFSDLFEDVELDYNAVTLAAKKRWAISKRNALYAKLGTSSFKYEFTDSNRVFADESGMGVVAGFGWQIRWYNGFGMTAGYEYHKMKDLKVNAYTIGVSYKF